MLELDDVHTYYGLSHVLQGVTLRVGAGEVVGLFGRNGVGKTTVMKTVTGWQPLSRGSITLDGQSIAHLSSHAICHRGVGLVPEDRRIFPGLTVEENLALGSMQVRGRSRAEARRRLDETYDRFPRLRERRQQLGTTLSGGEQQMLAMARVLMGEPKMLLIDEPTEGLAPMLVDELFDTMRRLSETGVPILLVEQNVRRAIELTHRFYVLERGTVVLTGHSASASDCDALWGAISV